MVHHHMHEAPKAYDKAFFIAIAANGLFVFLQLIYAYWANSTSLLADALHNLGDVLGLMGAWAALHLMKRKPTPHATYGMKKASILAALFNGSLLIFSSGVIATEALFKLANPNDINALSVIIIASIGIVINGSTALFFARGSHDLNIHGAFLHLVYDALISLGVVVAAIILYYTHWLWIDPIVGLLIALLIIKGAWSLFAQSFRLLIDGVPSSISWALVNKFFAEQPGVVGVHDLHIWALSTQENALSVHLYMPEEPLNDTLRTQWVGQIQQQFGIGHVTIQVECSVQECKDSCMHDPNVC